MVPVKSFKPGTVYWHGVTCSESGEVIVNGHKEIKFYNIDGKVTKRVPCPDVSYCTEGVSVLELTSQGVRYVARSCRYCKLLKVFKMSTCDDGESYQLSLHKEKRHINPVAMCHGGPGELCVIDQGAKEVIIFKISPRQVTERKSITIDMKAEYLCYYNIQNLGEVIATTSGSRPYFGHGHEKQPNICATRVSTGGTTFSGDRLWGIQVDWNPWGIASDDNGHLYVGDYTNHQIVVLSGRSGIILQYLRPSVLRKSIHVEEIMWNSKDGVLIVRHGIDGEWFISFLKDEPIKYGQYCLNVPSPTLEDNYTLSNMLATSTTSDSNSDSEPNYYEFD